MESVQYKVLRFADGWAALYVKVGPLFEHVHTCINLTSAESEVYRLEADKEREFSIEHESTEQTCY